MCACEYLQDPGKQADRVTNGLDHAHTLMALRNFDILPIEKRPFLKSSLRGPIVGSCRYVYCHDVAAIGGLHPGQSGYVLFLIFIKRLQSASIMHRQTNIQVNQYLMLT